MNNDTFFFPDFSKYPTETSFEFILFTYGVYFTFDDTVNVKN